MGAVQLQPVSANVGRHLGAINKLLLDHVHVSARHLLGNLAHTFQVLLLRGRHDGPVAFRQRQVRAIPGQLSRCLGTGVANLHAKLGIGVLVNPVADALPGRLLLCRISAGAAGRDATFRAHARHFSHHQACATHGACAQMHQVVVTRHAIDSRILGHGRDHNAVFQRYTAHGVRQEHGRRRLACTMHAILFGQPLLIAAQPFGIAFAQVFVADTLAAREHGIHELLRLQLVAIALAASLKPLHRVPGRVLNAQRLHPARLLVGHQHFRNVLLGIAHQLELTCQLNRIFNGQLGARANRKVGRMYGVAHQHHMAAQVVLEPPLIADHALEVNPGRAAQVAGVGHEFFALQVVGKNLFAESNGLVLIGRIQTAGLPGFFGSLDDERRCLVIKFVDVGLEPAMLGADKVKSESLVHLVCAQPDKAIGSSDDVGLENIGVLGADSGVHAIAGNDQIGIGIVFVRLHIGVEHQLDVQGLAALLQDIEQVLTPNPHKTVAAGANGLALEQQLDIVPMVERLLDLPSRDRVPFAHVLHGCVREHHPPTEGVIRLVALNNRNVMSGIHLLHEQCEIQTSGTTAYADNFHDLRPYE